MSGIILSDTEIKDLQPINPPGGIRLSQADLKDLTPIRNSEARVNQRSVPHEKIMGISPETISHFARPTLEGIGSVAGGLAGSPLGPEGAIGGGIGGFGIGRELSNLLDQRLGLRQSPQSPSDVIRSIGRDASQGAEMESGGLALSGIAKGIGATLHGLVPHMGPDALSRAKAMDTLGIDATPADLHQTKGLSQLEFLLNRSPLSGGVMEKAQKNQESAFLKKLMGGIGKDAAPSLDTAGEALKAAGAKAPQEAQSLLNKRLGDLTPPATLGQSAQEGLQGAADKERKSAGTLYDKVGQLLGEQKHVPTTMIQSAKQTLKELENIPDYASSILRTLGRHTSAPVGTKDPAILKFLGDPTIPDEIKKTLTDQLGATPGYTWKELQSIRSNLGQKIMEAVPPGVSPKMAFQKNDGIRRLTGLKSAVESDMMDMASTHPDAWDLYAHANAIYGKAARLYNTVAVRKTLASDPEKVMDQWIQPGNLTKILRAKKTFGDSGFAPLKQAFGQKLLGTPSSPHSPDQVRKLIDHYGMPVLNELYGKETARWIDQTSMAAVTSPFQRRLENTESGNVFSSLIAPGQAGTLLKRDALNVRNIQRVGQIAGPKGVQNLKSQLLTQVLSPTKDGIFTAKMFSDRMGAYGDRTLKALFPQNELKEIRTLVTVGQTIKGGERVVSNASGTSNMMLALTSAEASGAIGALFTGHPGAAVSLAFATVTPAGVAKLYLSKTGRTLLREGYSMKPGTPKAAHLAGKIAILVGIGNLKSKRVDH